jgi:YbbR domain-containing protein
LIKLSSNYSTEFSFPVKYTNPPQNLLLVNDVDEQIQIGLDEQGFTLARLKYFTKKRTFEIDLSDVKTRKSDKGYIATIPTKSWVQEMYNDFNIAGEITFIRPDTIVFMFEEVVSKTVDVVANFKYSFAKQYYIYDSVQLNPARVSISGLASIIDTITSLSTESTRFVGLSGTLETEIKLYNPLPGMLTLDPPSVGITIPVEKFTESEILVPVSIPKTSNKRRVKIFPDKVRVVYLVALKDFRKVNADMFSASIDPDALFNSNDTKIPVRVDAFPYFARIKKIDPPEVEYLILK